MARRRPLAVVTGAASGIGAATARHLVAQGYEVVGCDAQRCNRPRFATHRVDVTDANAIGALMDTLGEDRGPIDALVTCAGVAQRTDLDLGHLADWRRMIDVNLTGTLICIAAARPWLRQAPSPAIVTFGSELGIRAIPTLAVYAASKAGVIHLSRALARELAPEHIRVNCVCPGPVDTPMLRGADAAGPNTKRRLAAVARTTLLKRLGTTAEIAATVAFLLSPAARNMTGAVIVSDGGATV